MGDDELEQAIELARAEASRAWPDVALDAARFAAHVRNLLGDGDGSGALGALHTSDLYLACACAGGEPHALAAFDRHYLAPVGDYLAHIDRRPEFVDEVRQVLRTKLFLPREESPPLIADYRGRGALGGWVRVAAVRTALDLVRQRKPAAGAEAAEDLPAPGADPELDAVRALCRDEFASAFRSALAALDVRTRSALRLHFLDGLTLEETAAACAVSRATVARWIASGRDEVLAETQRLLRERLHITAGELESVFRYARSQLDLSLRRYL